MNRSTIFSLGVFTSTALAGVALAETRLDRPTPPAQCVDGICPAHPFTHGYFPTRWRVWPGSEVVEPGFSDRTDAFIARKPGDLGKGMIEFAGRRKAWRLIRMQSDGRHHLRMPMGDLDAPSRARQVVAHLNDTGHSDRRRVRERVRDGHPWPVALAVIADVQVAVTVDDRHRERLRKFGPTTRTGHGYGDVLRHHDIVADQNV